MLLVFCGFFFIVRLCWVSVDILFGSIRYLNTRPGRNASSSFRRTGRCSYGIRRSILRDLAGYEIVQNRPAELFHIFSALKSCRGWDVCSPSPIWLRCTYDFQKLILSSVDMLGMRLAMLARLYA